MADINLPKEMLDKSAFKVLSAKDKEEYVRNLLTKILDINPQGITISQIKEATALTYSTLWHHLEILKSTAQSRKMSHGNLDIYHPFGTVEVLKDYDIGQVRYSVGMVDNEDGKFIRVQEMRETRSGSYTLLRGIAIPYEIVDDLTKLLRGTKKKPKKKK